MFKLWDNENSRLKQEIKILKASNQGKDEMFNKLIKTISLTNMKQTIYLNFTCISHMSKGHAINHYNNLIKNNNYKDYEKQSLKEGVIEYMKDKPDTL